MKPEAWYDADNNFRPHDQAIAMMDFAQENHIRVYGHVLVWHGQTPAWFFQDAAGDPLTTSAADQQILRDRLHAHIFNVAQSLSDPVRPVRHRHQPARRLRRGQRGRQRQRRVRRRPAPQRVVPDPRRELHRPGVPVRERGVQRRRTPWPDRPRSPCSSTTTTPSRAASSRGTRHSSAAARPGRSGRRRGSPVPLSLSTAVDTLDGALTAFDSLPVVQAVTEMDVTTGTPVTQANLIEQGYFYRDAFRIFRAHASHIFSVTVWGLIDGRSWRASSGAPLIFNDGFQAKPAYYGAVDGDAASPAAHGERVRRRRRSGRERHDQPGVEEAASARHRDAANSSCAGRRTT